MLDLPYKLILANQMLNILVTYIDRYGLGIVMATGNTGLGRYTLPD